MVCGPIIAKLGSNVPATASVIPVPLHVPPGSAADKLNAATSAHNGFTFAIVASTSALTTIVSLNTRGQFPAVV